MSFQQASRGAVLICPVGSQYSTIEASLFELYENSVSFEVQSITPLVFGEWMFNAKQLEYLYEQDITYTRPDIDPYHFDITFVGDAAASSPGYVDPLVDAHILTAPNPNLDYFSSSGIGPRLIYIKEPAVFYNSDPAILSVPAQFIIHQNGFYLIMAVSPPPIYDTFTITISATEIKTVAVKTTPDDIYSITETVTNTYTINSTFY